MPRSKSNKNVRKPAAKRATKPTFDKRVKAVISRMAENKIQNYRGTINVRAQTSTGWDTTVIPCTPFTAFLSIPQGVSQGERVGNTIRVKKLKFSGVLRPLPYNATSNPEPTPLFVKIMWMTRKDSPMEIFTSMSDLLQFGGSSESPGFQLVNLQRPINLDEWTVHTHRTYKLGYSAYNGISSDTNYQFYENNDFKMNQFVNVDLTKYCVKNIKFDDNSVNPTTRNICMYAMVYRADSGTPAITDLPAALDFNLDFEYEDV